MSTVVCATESHSLPAHRPQGRYHWPTTGTSASVDRTNRPSALRLVTPDSSAPAPIREHLPAMLGSSTRTEAPTASSSRVSTASAAPPPSQKKEHRRAPTDAKQSQIAPIHPFPSSGSSSSARPSPTHVRAKSTIEPTASLASAPTSTSTTVRTARRARAASSATLSYSTEPLVLLQHRPRLLTSVLTQHKAPAQTRTTAHDPDLVGSFAPTSSPRPRLHSLLSGLGAGFSTSTSSSRAESPQPSPRSPLAVLQPIAVRAHSTLGTRTRSRHQSDVRRRPCSPPRSPDLPSICRTPSSECSGSSDSYFPTAPSSAGPPTPVHTVSALPLGVVGVGPGVGVGPKVGASMTLGRKSESLHPVLESLEHRSMFRVQTACAACGKSGSNFPCCPKCGEMWCSRQCRLQKGDGKRHICAKKSM